MSSDRDKAAAAALNDVAAALQRLAVAILTEPSPAEPELDRTELARDRDKAAARGRTLPAAVCGCTLGTICDEHARSRPRRCACSGPWFRSSECEVAGHAVEASLYPELDPARA